MNRRIPRRAASFRMRLAWLVLLALAAVAAVAGTSLGAARSGSIAPADTTPPLIMGEVQAGHVLSATSGSWSGTTPITFTYQWQRCDAAGASCTDVAAAASQTYSLASSDVGSTVRVAVTATNSAGSMTAHSVATSQVTAADSPLNTSLPAISGEARQNETLTASSGTWQGAQPIGFSYGWSRCDSNGADCSSIGSASAQSHTLTSADVGHTLRVTVTATNAYGSSSVLSGPSAVVAVPGTAPASTSVPAVSGSALQGSTLTLSSGSWSGTAPFTFAYSWQRCDTGGDSCTPIAAATEPSYVVASADVGHTLRGSVTASNAAGSSTAYSTATPVVSSQAPFETAAPAISGTLQSGSTLSATAGSWSGVPPIAYFYQWARSNAEGGFDPIAGAVHSTYTLGSGDVGHQLFVQVKAINQYGAAFADSSIIGPVAVGAPEGSGVSSPGHGLSAGETRLANGRISISVADESLPNRLVISRVGYRPLYLGSRAPFSASYQVTDTRGFLVRGALVYALGIPYGWVRSAPEAVTNSDGVATIQLVPTPRMPLRRGSLVIYVRARKPGERIIAGVTTSRLTQVRIR